MNKSTENGTRTFTVRDNSYYRHNHRIVSARISISLVFHNTHWN
jgi:hypothetical protein